MGMMDTVKDWFSTGKDKAGDLAKEKGPQVKDGVDKAAGFVKEKTGGKHDDTVDTVAEKAKDGVDKIAGT